MANIRVVLSKESIDLIFDDAAEQGEYVINLYKAVIPDWDKVQQVTGYPSMSPNVSDYIWAKAIQYDTIHHPNVICGGAWMNNGFTVGKDLPDWTAAYDEDIVIYKEVEHA